MKIYLDKNGLQIKKSLAELDPTKFEDVAEMMTRLNKALYGI